MPFAQCYPMFCIKCGKEAVAGNFCKKCFLDSNRLFAIRDFTTRVCQNCGKLEEGPIEEQIKKKIETKNRITYVDIKSRQSGNRINADVACEGFIHPLKSLVKENHKILITLKKTKCTQCVELSGGYYEAVLQVRGEQQERIMRKLEKMVDNENISRVIKLKEGYDVRLIKKSSAPKIARFLREYFTIKESYKLVGEKKGKRLYRNYYAVR